MSRKRTTGARGPRGKPGRPGPPGPPGNGAVAELALQMTEILKQLHTQFQRIAEIQLQLDRLATGDPPEPADRRATKRTKH